MHQNQNSQINIDWFHRHKLFLATLVIVIIGSGLIFQWKVDYYRQHNLAKDFPVYQVGQNLNAGWLSYTNFKYNFEFIYPADYQVKETKYSDSFAVEIIGPQTDNIAQVTSGELSDSIFIVPNYKMSVISEDTLKDDYEKYLGEVNIDGKIGYSWWGLETQRKYVAIKDDNGAGLLVDGGLFNYGKDTRGLNPPTTTVVKIEPYDSIVASLKFSK